MGRLRWPRHPGVQTAWSFSYICPHPCGSGIRQNDPVVNIALAPALCTDPDSYHPPALRIPFLFLPEQLLCFCACSFMQSVMCSQHQTGISAPTSTERILPEENVCSCCSSLGAAGAVTSSLRFSWAVDWQDSQQCRSSLNPSAQGPSVFLQNHRTGVCQQAWISSSSQAFSSFFSLVLSS